MATLTIFRARRLRVSVVRAMHLCRCRLCAHRRSYIRPPRPPARSVILRRETSTSVAVRCGWVSLFDNYILYLCLSSEVVLVAGPRAH